MLPPLIDRPRLEAWLQVELEPSSVVFVEAASAAVRHEAGQTWAVDGELVGVPDIAAMIALAVAARMVANPTGVTQQQTGPFGAMMSAEYMTDGERDTLRSLRTTSAGRVSGLGVINVTRGPLEMTRCGWLEEGVVPVIYPDGTTGEPLLL
jgi:hypothetical protein